MLSNNGNTTPCIGIRFMKYSSFHKSFTFTYPLRATCHQKDYKSLVAHREPAAATPQEPPPVPPPVSAPPPMHFRQLSLSFTAALPSFHARSPSCTCPFCLHRPSPCCLWPPSLPLSFRCPCYCYTAVVVWSFSLYMSDEHPPSSSNVVT